MSHQADEQWELLGQLEQLIAAAEQSSASRAGTAGEERNRGLEAARAETAAVGRAQEPLSVRPDPGRERRKGAPEVLFGETKDTAQVIAMAQALLEASGRAIISRMRSETKEALLDVFRDYTIRLREAARAMVISRPDFVRPSSGGHVGIITAGTSDVPVAEEAALVAEEMGCRVTCIYDVGVAGLHRLLGPLRELLVGGVDAIVVAAGMDGALPSVVAGLVPVPVIGLPTSIGYGLGGKGLAALLSMLQTCAPGLAVVNIDNGVGAGITAALIANRVAQAREHLSR
jgi:NCAIR mutase (PurE)-related protein